MMENLTEKYPPFSVPAGLCGVRTCTVIAHAREKKKRGTPDIGKWVTTT
jgi:hypothetical protein